MMRPVMLALFVLLLATIQRSDAELRRDVAPNLLAQQDRIEQLLPSKTKQRAADAIRGFERAAFSGKASRDPYAGAAAAVSGVFPGSKPPKLDILVYYVLSEAAQNAEREIARLEERDKLGGLSEEMSLRLQILMERRAKILQTLSNILKKISQTADTVVQNIK